MYSALRKTGCEAGNWVVVSGAGGGLGHLAVQIAARAMGFRVIGIDHGSKKDLVMQCGAEVFIDYQNQDPVKETEKVTKGLKAHAVVVVNANNHAYAQGMELLRFAGTLVCVGLPEGDMKAIAGAFPSVLVVKSQNIKGSAVGNRKEAIETLELAERGLLKTNFKVEKMDKLNSVFEQMEKGELLGRIVLDLSD